MKKLFALMLIGQAGLTHANSSVIYLDQIQYEALGEGVCSAQNRLITKSEAEIYRNDIVKKMGKWQITGLADGWVIMGPGY